MSLRKHHTTLLKVATKSSFKGSSSSINLNSTFMGSTLSLCNLSGVQCTTKLDELELRNTYWKYQLACLKEAIINNKISYNESVYEDQLCIFMEQTGHCKQKEYALQEQITNEKVQKELSFKLAQLRAEVDEVTLELTPRFKNLLDLLLNLVDALSNKLYLKNIEPIGDQEGLDELEVVFANISKNIKGIFSTAGNPEGLRKLTDAIVSLQEKQSLMDTENTMLAAANESLCSSTLTCLYDLFVKFY